MYQEKKLSFFTFSRVNDEREEGGREGRREGGKKIIPDRPKNPHELGQNGMTSEQKGCGGRDVVLRGTMGDTHHTTQHHPEGRGVVAKEEFLEMIFFFVVSTKHQKKKGPKKAQVEIS